MRATIGRGGQEIAVRAVPPGFRVVARFDFHEVFATDGASHLGDTSRPARLAGLRHFDTDPG